MQSSHLCPQLCIDARAAVELSSRGLLVQETLEQMLGESLLGEDGLEPAPAEGESSDISLTVPVEGAEPEPHSPLPSEPEPNWLVQHAPAWLLHPEQTLPGGADEGGRLGARIDTRLRLRRSPWHWAWERRLLKERGFTACHRFRPVDRLSPFPPCSTLTTVLPPIHGLPFFLSRRANQSYIVPSQADARLLERNYQIDPERVRVIRPGVRRFIRESAPLKPTADGYTLFLVGQGRDLSERKKLVRILSDAFPELGRKILPLEPRRGDFGPAAWLKWLQGARVCFYLTALPFDWPTLALEALNLGIPTIFPDQNTALAELLPHSPFKLSRFLVDKPSLLELKREALRAQASLETQEIWSPDYLGARYRAAYAASFAPVN